MKYYRVKYGYGGNDFYSVNEEEVKKAIRAQINGTVAIFEEGTVAGNHIISISPDYNRLLGYNSDYVLTGEDMREISTQQRQDHEFLLKETRAEITGQKLPVKEISSGVKQLAEKMNIPTRDR